MKHSLVLLLLLFSVWANAQIKNIEIKAAANSTFINSTTKALNPITPLPLNPSTGFTQTTLNLGSIKESYESKLGFDVTSTFQVWENKFFFIRTGLGILYLRYHKKITLENQLQELTLFPGYFPGTNIQVGNPYGTLIGGILPRDVNGSIIIGQGGLLIPQPDQIMGSNPNLGKTTALYLQLPVSIGRMFFSDKLIVSANLQAQFLAQATVVKEQYSYGSLVEYKDKSSDGFNNTLFLIGVECAYKIIKPIYISIAYNRSLTPIYDEAEQIGGKTFYNNVSLGLNYSIRK